MSKKYTTAEFIEKAKNAHGNYYDYSMCKYVNAITKVTIGCSTHGQFTQKACDHHYGYGCPKCNKMYVDTKKFIEKANLVHNNAYDYSLTEYVDAKTKIIIVCRIHGKFDQRTNDHLRGSGCPHCKKSHGENLITNYLIERGIYFEREKKFDKCMGVKRKLPFDFYLPQNNLLIEYDGEHHFAPIGYWGGEVKFKLQQNNDQIRDLFANTNGIKLLRIKFNEINNINEILKNIL